ncbi:hypothetical protein HZB60_04710 [candidate division KSB1 bacterium]|nr:hypothetical protein [candidate division KSB1 bacterium]
MRILLTAILGLGLLVSSGLGQWRGTTPGGDTGEYLRTATPSKALRGLLDPSRMHMSQSLSMGYYNGGGLSGSRGLYMNRIDYQLSRPLSLTTHLGYQFQPSGPSEWNPATNGTSFVGGADLNWRPGKNYLISLSAYQNMSPYGSFSRYGGYSPSGNYGWDPYGRYFDPWRP